MEADVINGAVSVVAENTNVTASRAGTRAVGAGEPTDVLFNLTNAVDDNGKITDEKLYNDLEELVRHMEFCFWSS